MDQLDLALDSGDLERVRTAANQFADWLDANEPNELFNTLLIAGVLLSDSRFEAKASAALPVDASVRKSYHHVCSQAYFSARPNQYSSALLQLAKSTNLKPYADLESALSDEESKELALLLTLNRSTGYGRMFMYSIHERIRSQRFVKVKDFEYARGCIAAGEFDKAILVAKRHLASSNKRMRARAVSIIGDADEARMWLVYSAEASIAPLGISRQRIIDVDSK